ncbi:DUF11 domain-containing protein [Streptomyces sp. Je 1-79]|uniref:DUF11 domain-containing protein n=1 Tax=Streptomyces sp. Je 1-79 TaxID=2943847 RepID=UPI0021A3C882|nr:DUF11 domain-containing protein [Streptomyces sp. Je 1-79]MCT4357697.1 DUF11 domain-containing protein [Streptomyces sp. Je 1-79]
MATHTFGRRMSAVGTVLGLGLGLPFAFGVTSAYAAAQLEITKTHTGDFARGGQGVYRITVTNSGDEASGGTEMTDTFPAGLQIDDLNVVDNDVAVSCVWTQTLTCNTPAIPAGQGYAIDVTVLVAADAPCNLTNTAIVEDTPTGASDSASDPTTVTGGDCDDDGEEGGGVLSILPVNLNGVLPMFNNISTNNNINSPGASNTNGQKFSLTAP